MATATKLYYTRVIVPHACQGNTAQRKRNLNRLSSELLGDFHAASQSRPIRDTLTAHLRGLSSEHDGVEKFGLLLLGGRKRVEQILGENHIAAAAATTSAANR